MPIPFTWDFGNGMLTEAPRSPLLFREGGQGGGSSVTHTYATPGAYTVTLTATNGCGVEVVKRAIVVVAEPPQVYEIYLPILLKNALGTRKGE
jgi:PKD repeat protein